MAADSAAAGGAQNGTSASASPQWQPTGGIIGGAIRMSATAQADVDENVTHTAAADIIPDYPFTLSSWVNTTSSVAYRETFVYLGDQTTGAEYAQTSKEPNNAATNPNRGTAAARNTNFFGATGGLSLTDGAWHHVVGVYNSATSRTVYVDGQQAGTNTTNVPVPDTTRFSIGALMRNTPTDSYNGMLDDVGLWDESLTPVRIALAERPGPLLRRGARRPVDHAGRNGLQHPVGLRAVGPVRVAVRREPGRRATSAPPGRSAATPTSSSTPAATACAGCRNRGRRRWPSLRSAYWGADARPAERRRAATTGDS